MAVHEPLLEKFGGRIQHQTAETKKIDSPVKPVFKSNGEQLETEDDERVADLETDNKNNRNAESQDAEDLQKPRRSDRTRKPPERDGTITRPTKKSANDKAERKTNVFFLLGESFDTIHKTKPLVVVAMKETIPYIAVTANKPLCIAVLLCMWRSGNLGHSMVEFTWTVPLEITDVMFAEKNDKVYAK
eukprot:gene1177-15537_t